jgi:hypothetical protein
MKSDYRSTLLTASSVAGNHALRRRSAIGDIRSACLYHPPLGITIHFDHRKFGGCWRDPCARRLCPLSTSDRARIVYGSRNFPRKVGLPDVFHF